MGVVHASSKLDLRYMAASCDTFYHRGQSSAMSLLKGSWMVVIDAVPPSFVALHISVLTVLATRAGCPVISVV